MFNAHTSKALVKVPTSKALVKVKVPTSNTPVSNEPSNRVVTPCMARTFFCCRLGKTITI